MAKKTGSSSSSSKKTTKKAPQHALVGKVVLVRDNRAGIHVGTLMDLDLAAKTCTLKGARKVWYWKGAASCHGIAARGLSHAGSKVAPPVELVASCDVVEVILMSDAAAENLRACPVWTPPDTPNT